MNFFKNLFGLKGADNSQQITKRAVRIGGSLLRDIYFEFVVDGKSTKIQIANLSTSGVLLMGYEFTIGDIIPGKVGYQDKSIAVQVEIVRKDTYLFGGKVKDSNGDYERFMQNIFELEFAAAEASIIPAEKLKEVDFGEPVWIISRNGHSIYLIVHEGKIHSYTIHLGKFLVERKHIDSKNIFKVYTVDEGMKKVLNYKVADLLLEERPTDEIYEIAKKLVGSISGLSDEFRQEIEIDLYKAFKGVE